MALSDDPSEVYRCRENASHVHNLTLRPSLSYFIPKKYSEEVPVFLTRMPDEVERWRIVTVSEKARSGILIEYSIITLYVSVVLVVGRFIRGIFYGSSFIVQPG